MTPGEANQLLQQAKELLPIPLQWRHFGFPGTATDHCTLHSPFRPDDDEPSFSIFDNGKAFKDHGCGGETWDSYVTALSAERKAALAKWRGCSESYIAWLAARKLIGFHNGCCAFPVFYKGVVVGAHCRISPDARLEKAKWYYTPKLSDIGIAIQPFILGELADALIAFGTESQWDQFILNDKLVIHETEGVVTISTRGADNAKLLSRIPASAKEIILWPQSDKPSEKWLADALEVLSDRLVRIARIPNKFNGHQIKDVNELVQAGGGADELLLAMKSAEVRKPQPKKKEALEPKERKILIEFLSPSEIKYYTRPPGIVLVGENHIVRGNVSVIAGPAGVGKSRSGTALGVAGATHSWFGLPVHVKFKTLILQNENGRFRLKQEFAELDETVLDNYIRISPPPPYGLCFSRSDFRDQLSLQIQSFAPDVVLLDPWNAMARDERARDCLETFDLVRSVIPAGDAGPAIVIIAHTRKPQPGERANGRDLLNLLSGSYVLGAVPRTVFVIQSASDDVNETRVVFTCCKNNDGELGEKTAWVRKNGLFASVNDFDWEEWDSAGKAAKRTFEMASEIVAKSHGPISRKNLALEITKKGVPERTHRLEELRDGLVHPVHQQLRVFAYEVLGA